MAKFNGLTLASNGALRALLAGTKTETDRNNAIAAVSHFLQGQPDGFGAHLTTIILARAIDQQMSDLTCRQQDWRSALGKEAAELREKVIGLDKTVQGFATGLDQLTRWHLGLAGLAGCMLGLIMFPAIAFLMDWVRQPPRGPKLL